jgi:hypothetical protein
MRIEMNHKYISVADRDSSMLVIAEGEGMSFHKACNTIIQYCEDSGYNAQKTKWEVTHGLGEQNYLKTLGLVKGRPHSPHDKTPDVVVPPVADMVAALSGEQVAEA